MTPEQAAAFINAQSVAAMAEVQAMIAANTERLAQDCSLVYDEAAFLAVIDKYGLHHNAVLTTFAEANGGS